MNKHLILPPRIRVARATYGFRLLILAVGLGFLLIIGGWNLFRATRAEFEVPLIDTTFLARADLRDVWSYFRNTRTLGSLSPDYTGSLGTNEFVHALAVGETTDGRASVIQLRNGKWEQVMPVAVNNGTEYRIDGAFNAIAGAYEDGGGYADFFVGGYDSTTGRAIIRSASTLDSRIFAGCSASAGRLQPCDLAMAFQNNNNQLYSLPGGSTEIYAMDAVPRFLGRKYAGGVNGLFLEWVQAPNATNTCSAGRCTENNLLCGGDSDCRSNRWDTVTAGPPFLGSSEDITGVALVQGDLTYITTSTFAGTKPYDRVCGAGQRSKLYRLVGRPTTGDWTTLIDTGGTGVCFYGLAADTKYTFPGDHGPLQGVVWIAAGRSDGSGAVYRFDEGTGVTSISSTAQGVTTPVYSVTALPDRGGDGQNILTNGDFEAWSVRSPIVTDPNVRPDQWPHTDESKWGRNNPGASCGQNSMDVRIVDSTQVAGVNGYGIRQAPGIYFDDQLKCLTNLSVDRKRNASASSYNRVDLSTIEGTTFKVSGRYKVTFDPAADSPQYPQGGVMIQCQGANYPSSVDCSFSNFREVRTLSQGNSSLDSRSDANGFINFSYTFSRQNNQFLTPILGGTSGPRVLERGEVLEIRCYATYGVDVVCDDLAVEPVNSPNKTPRFNYTVIAVGENDPGNPNAFVNRDGLGSTTFVPEDDTEWPDLNAVHGFGQQQVFTVGADSTILQRTPGNVLGYVWLGSASPVDLGRAGLGWISTTCINHRTPGGTLCLRSPESFALTVENNQLIGRAWVGKNYGTAPGGADKESANLGRCRRASLPSPTASGAPYDKSGACNTASRTCVANANQACLRDFDCYGRCEKNEGFICVSDADCRASPFAAAAPFDSTGSRLAREPRVGLECAQSNASPSACAGGGWLTFSASEFTDTPPNAINPNNDCGVSGGACLDAASGQLKGWGQFMTLAQSPAPNGDPERGWVSLRGLNSTDPPLGIIIPGGGTWLYGCQVCSGAAVDSLTCQFCQDGKNRSCAPPPTSCTNFCDGDITKAHCSQNVHCPGGEVCKPAGFCAWSGERCTSDAECVASSGGRCIFGALCPTTGSSCQEYGVNLSSENGRFYGYAWSPDYGWLDFGLLSRGSRRYIQATLGDIYSQGGIGSESTLPAPSGKSNATFAISAAGTINNFSTTFAPAAVDFDVSRSLAPFIPSLTERNKYASALGRLDLDGIANEATGGSGINKYGSRIVALTTAGPNDDIASDWNSQLDLGGGNTGRLDGRVFRAGTSGQTLTIENGVRIRNATNAAPYRHGSGMLIVEGDLYVKEDVTYGASTVQDLRTLASLMVWVKGDLMIDNHVTQLAGNYLVEGTICTGQKEPYGAADPPACDPVRVGPFGGPTSDNVFPLTVRGVMLAKKFFFARTFAGTIDNPSPSELVINDGRLQTNPLPGLTDFANVLPSTVNTGP
ncbi:MAG: hypothetical protein HYY50_01515 [Candidatus Kerfeldbacteria bacterium]|nr:hypothetical protein [Candidatus Kerfeldbacteria bacterium]